MSAVSCFQRSGCQLDLTEERESFNHRYGNGAERIDDTGSTWQLNPRDYHSTEDCLNIAGYTLARGFHWDVVTSAPRDFNTPKYSCRVTGHFNVYPDAFFRSGRGRFQQPR